MNIKPITWLADSKDRLSEFPDEARSIAGFELWEVQQGKAPSDWKPMPSVDLGVKEIRVHVDGAFRILYLAKFAEAVYVVHTFQKKTRQTPKAEIDLARTRFRELIRERKQR
ncbi:MAG: type II toxin-antitoxin system RelE/ParE family toxin [Burkholderiales bacterium]